MNEQRFSPEVLSHIQSETFVEGIDFHPEIASTNSRALELAKVLAEIPGATLVLTERQTAGRGRGENNWWSGEGGLTFSLLIDCDAIRLPSSRWPIISLVTGLAVCDAIEAELDRAQARLKWPNDVYLQGCKACGILVEVPDSRRGRVVIGIGINVNNVAAHAPLELRGHLISMSDLALQPVSPSAVLMGILQHLSSRIDRLVTGDLDLRSDWQKRCLLTGQRIEIKQESRQIMGMCHGIDDDGALVIESDLGIERCLSGTVTHFSCNSDQFNTT